MTMHFEPAVRSKNKLRLGLSGPSGSGKTEGALRIAAGLGGKIAVIDTENKSASLYADIVPFQVLDLAPPFTPERFIQAHDAAQAAGFDILILDSGTHEWNGVGGILEIVDALAAGKYRGNKFAAWNDATPRHRHFVEMIQRSKMHIICTMRSKAAYIEGEKNGKKTIEKVGMAAEQREGFEYELTTVLDLNLEHWATSSKDRTRLFAAPQKLTEDTGRRLLEWLESGVDVVEPEHESEPAPARVTAPPAWMTTMEGKVRSATNEADLADMRTYITNRLIDEGQEKKLITVCDEIAKAIKLEHA